MSMIPKAKLPDRFFVFWVQPSTENVLLRLRYIPLVLSVTLLFLSCRTAPKTPQEKAEALIAAMFEAPKNHTYGYEAGEFGKLDSAYSSYRDDSVYKVFEDSVSYYLDKRNCCLWKSGRYWLPNRFYYRQN